VRELENLVESLMVTSSQEVITLRDIPADLLQEINPRLQTLPVEPPVLLPGYVQKVETEHILKLLDQCGSQREAARRLGVHQSTISRKLRRTVPRHT
jgi:transcriptional regulator with PAS, ATPase and Fis domain